MAIIDLAHCGTTMAAGVLERIGVPMVLGHDNGKLEDQQVIAALNTWPKIKELAQARAGLTWGFKYPGAWKFAVSLRDGLIDPVFLAIYKDPVSVTLRRFGKLGGGKLHSTAAWMAENIDGLRATGLPVHWLSYLDAMRNPCGFTTRLADLAGVRVNGGQMDSVLQWMTRGSK